MKECSLYKHEGKNIRCFACSQRCIISRNNVGICGVRKNIDNKLYLLVYGKIAAEHVDPVEKKPLYHFLPETYAYSIGTVGCNFRCGFCQNYDISQLREAAGAETKPEQIISKAIKNKCKSIAYTYNEPAIFIEFVKDIAILAHKKGLKNILVTNGYFTPESLNYISNYADAMNIDLKSFNDKFYLQNCKARLKPVLDTIKLAHKKGIHIEITTLIIPGQNDSDKEFEEIAKFILSVDKNIPWHISRFFPVYKMKNLEPTPKETLDRAYKISKKYLNYVYVGNI